MKKLIPSTWVNTQKIEIFTSWTFYIALLAVIGLWAFYGETALIMISGSELIVLAICGLIMIEVRKNFKKALCDFNSEEVEDLNGKYLFTSDAFPAYWSEDASQTYIVVHPLSEPAKQYIFCVPTAWYISLQELPRYMRTHLQFKKEFEGQHKFHAIGMNAFPMNHFLGIKKSKFIKRVKMKIA